MTRHIGAGGQLIGNYSQKNLGSINPLAVGKLLHRPAAPVRPDGGEHFGWDGR
jgi:hypothetical protein